IGAAVDLRRAHLQQVRELRLDAALVNELLQAEHGAVRSGRNRSNVQTSLHDVLLRLAELIHSCLMASDEVVEPRHAFPNGRNNGGRECGSDKAGEVAWVSVTHSHA